MNEREYAAQLETYRKIPGVSMASPCFKSEDGKKTVMSNNFYVKLKDKNDMTLFYETASK